MSDEKPLSAAIDDPMPPDDLIEITDPTIDPAAIMTEIRRRIAQRRQELGYENRSLPTYGAAFYQGEPEDIDYDRDLHYFLRLANITFAEAETEPVLAESPATRLPIVGRLWRMVRRSAHDLVLFYVNRSVVHQTNVNSYLVSALNRLTMVVEDQQRTIQRLQAELDAIRQCKPSE